MSGDFDELPQSTQDLDWFRRHYQCEFPVERPPEKVVAPLFCPGCNAELLVAEQDAWAVIHAVKYACGTILFDDGELRQTVRCVEEEVDAEG